MQVNIGDKDRNGSREAGGTRLGEGRGYGLFVTGEVGFLTY